jgi:hypothetical protein
MVAPQATDGLKLLSSGAGLIPVVGSELSILIDIALQFCENAEVSTKLLTLVVSHLNAILVLFLKESQGG